MQISFETDATSLKKAVVYITLKSGLARKIILTILFCYVVFSSVYYNYGFIAGLIAFCAALTGCGLLFFRPYFKVMKALNKQLLEQHATHWHRVIITSEAGFIFKSNEKSESFSWQSVRSAHRDVRYMVLDIRMLGGIIIPNDAFNSPQDAAAFFKMFKLSEISNNARHKKEKPKPLSLYYWLGLLGILPFIGGLAGFFLVFMGSFKFKDVRLVLLGALDVGIFLIYLWGFTTLPGEIRKAEWENNKVIVASGLNNAVKSVELYKLQNGSYPDTISQVTNKDDLTFMIDFFSREKSKQFHYQKLGKKYTVFSVGPDGKAGTGDDIYPAISITDSSKIGLIRP